MHLRTPYLVLLALLACACPWPSRLAAQDNTLILVADDVGVDAVSAYRVAAAPAPTPVIDSLAARGVLFERAWATPMCSPTRAQLHTGRYAFRTGVGNHLVLGWFGRPLRITEHTLPEVLDRAGYEHALIGKWHLGRDGGTGDLAPNVVGGWSYFAGQMQNFNRYPFENYFSWERVENGRRSTSRIYATTANVDDALAWIRSRRRPWVCMVCFNAAHVPFHAPPRALHGYDLRGKNPFFEPRPFFQAMVQAMDTEIGRLLAGLGAARRARTNVIFVGDNGSPREVIAPPFGRDQAKGTLFEGGVRVPLIVAGPAVRAPGRRERALVHVVDLFATVAELSGVDARAYVPRSVPLDSISLVPYLRAAGRSPLRRTMITERFGANDRRLDGVAIRDDTHKLIVWTSPWRESLYDLSKDPFERHDLLTAPLGPRDRARYQALRAELRRMAADFQVLGPGCEGSIAPRLVRTGGLPRRGGSLELAVEGLPRDVRAVVGIAGRPAASWQGRRLPLDLAVLGAPGCRLLVPPEAVTPLAPVAGRWPWRLRVPDDPRVFGHGLLQQALVLGADRAYATGATRAVFGER